jgi:predicted glycosyl hydrolase (DUF1957 family)
MKQQSGSTNEIEIKKTNMITWIDFLHIYQPPTQTKHVIDKVVDESYIFILSMLNKHPRMKLTMNITGSLLELLEEYGHSKIIDSFKKYWEEGRIELTGSAMYHGFLPLLPESEVIRQIELNKSALKKYFGEACEPKGFYMPEMAYSKKVADIVKDQGFTWTILDEIHFDDVDLNPDEHYSIKNNGLKVLFRNKVFSKPPVWLFTHKNEVTTSHIITGNDGEMYGHWHKDDGFYDKAFADKELHMVTISEYLKENLPVRPVKVRSGSWESKLEEIKKGVPYALWDSPKNPVHSSLWNFANIAIKLITKYSKDDNYVWARKHLDRGLASCAWWWASNKKFHDLSPITWNPEEIEKGAFEMLKAVRSLFSATPHEKVKTEELYNDLRLLVWKTHWTMKPKKS